MAKGDHDHKLQGSATVARLNDGTIQITFTIPYSEIKKEREEVLKEEAKNVEVPGFRKGMAPLSEVEKKVDQNRLLETTLSKILPHLLGHAIADNKIKPAIYPKFELISAKEDEDWQVRAVTCEIPQIDLTGYKDKIKGALRAESIWVPGKSTKKESTPRDSEEARIKKENETIKALLANVKINLPKILVDDEVNARLAKLLERIEKLGLSLDAYLASIGKKPQDLRSDYEVQAKEAISLDLILTQIAQEEKLEIDPKDIDGALKAGQADPKLGESINTPERKLVIENILKRRKALDFLLSLA